MFFHPFYDNDCLWNPVYEGRLLGGSVEVAFRPLIIGVILLLAGGGSLSSTISETMRKLLKK